MAMGTRHIFRQDPDLSKHDGFAAVEPVEVNNSRKLRHRDAIQIIIQAELLNAK